MRAIAPSILGESITQMFRGHVQDRPDDVAVTMILHPDRIAGDLAVTYRELDAEARTVAHRLREGSRTGDRAMILYPSGPRFVAAFLGCLYAGVIAIPAPPPRRRREQLRLTAIARHAAVSTVLTDAADLTAVDEWLATDHLTGLSAVVTGDGGPELSPDDLYAADAETVALLQYTSGSTGDPKGVMLSHGNILHNIAASLAMTSWDGPLRVCSWLPLYHDMGLIATVLAPLLRGGSTVLMDPMTFVRRPATWLRAIHHHGSNASAAPNFAYELCARTVGDGELEGVDLSGLERLYNAAESIDAAVLAKFADRFARWGFRRVAYVTSYGLAEATLTVSARLNDSGEVPTAPTGEPGSGRHPVVSCGAAPYLDLRIVDPATGDVLTDGTEGEIWLRGPSVSRGYWRQEEDTAAVFGGVTSAGEGPFLRTGDVGFLRDGELYVSGRLSDLLVVRGQKVFPQDIETELRERHPQLGAYGAVFSAPEDADRVVITFELGGTDPGDLSVLAREMMHTAAKEFGVRGAAVLLLGPGEVARTTSGKVRRSEMRRRYATGRLQSAYRHDLSRRTEERTTL
jgi:acyl-CoA synthetase (AMP-forming)/AMP-acid ligase II